MYPSVLTCQQLVSLIIILFYFSVSIQLKNRLFSQQVLFQWLRLPQLTDAPDHIVAKQRSRLTLFSGRRVLSSRSSSLPRATNTLLLRLSAFHPLPSLIIEWRHIHGVLEKSFASLVSACTLAANDSMVGCFADEMSFLPLPRYSTL